MNTVIMQEIQFNRERKTFTLTMDVDMKVDQNMPKSHGKFHLLTEKEWNYYSAIEAEYQEMKDKENT